MGPEAVGALIGCGLLFALCFFIPLNNEEYRAQSHSARARVYTEPNNQSDIRSSLLHIPRGRDIVSPLPTISEV